MTATAVAIPAVARQPDLPSLNLTPLHNTILEVLSQVPPGKMRPLRLLASDARINRPWYDEELANAFKELADARLIRVAIKWRRRVLMFPHPFYSLNRKTMYRILGCAEQLLAAIDEQIGVLATAAG